jgi:hypothetical protein
MVSPFPKLLTENPTTKSVMTKASYHSARPAMNSNSPRVKTLPVVLAGLQRLRASAPPRKAAASSAR